MIDPIELIHVANESIRQAYILPLTNARELKTQKTKLQKQDANLKKDP
jgi:hypothetical protein